MKTVGAVLDHLVFLQSGLSIASPVAAAVKRAYRLAPNRADALTDLPCWLNAWTLARTDRTFDGLTQYYTVRMQLFVDDADSDRGAAIATAFHDAFVAAWNADTGLGGTVDNSVLRGGTPTICLLDWGGRSYPGLDLMLDVELYD